MPHGSFDRIGYSDPRHLPADGDPELYYSPAAQFRKYVSDKDLKTLMTVLKAVYAAVDEQAAPKCLGCVWSALRHEVPKNFSALAGQPPGLNTYFKYPQEVRRLIYATNATQGLNRQLRKMAKAKSVFPAGGVC